MMGVTHYRPAFPSRASRRLTLLFLAILALLSCDLFDIFPPEIEIITPKEGTSYFATLPVEVKASDNRKITKVEVFLDGTSVHEFAKEPYKADLDLSAISGENTTLKAIAHDQAGNSADASRDVNVTIGLRLTAPNGGETWAEQSNQTITWESSGNVGSTVSLHYSTDGGSTWDEITTSTANNGTYAWTLPNFSETQSACKIKVSTSQYVDDSDDTFTITAEPNTITLTSPNGGEVLAEQSTQIITWTSSGDVGDNVGLDYSLDEGMTWTLIVSSTGNDGSHSWTLPNLLESVTTCRIKLASTTTSYADTSDANFTISAEPNHITIISPNGGETWAEQSIQTITWTYSGDVGDHVSLGYSIDGGTNWSEIIASTSNDGSHAWNIPNFLDTQSACRVRVASTSTAFADTSDADFTITTEPNFISLTSPNGGEVWAEQSAHNIAWSKNGDVGDYVDLAFSSDGGTSWQTVISYTENDGSHSWVLPNFLETSATCRVKVASTSTSFADTSDSDFTITAEPNYITLTSPSGGEVWDEQSTHNITWTRSGDVGSYVSLHYSTDGGTTWNQIISSTANEGTHSWTLPNFLETSTTCRVKIASTSTSFADASDSDFTITAEPNYITIANPNGSETWAEQSTHDITWNYSGDVGNYVSLALSLDGGNSWQTIIASTENDGLHSWILPNLLETSTTCRVKIASTSTSFADTSDVDFTITAEPNYITVISPNGGEVWDEQSAQSITWSRSGDVGDNVDIHYSLDSGISWSPIIASTQNDGSHTWTLPNLSETFSTCRVKIASTSTSFADTSAADFTLTGGEITITAPDGGEDWREWSDQTITWTSSGDVGASVSLLYSLVGGTTWTEITGSTPNNGSYQWTIPTIDTDHTNCLVRVSSTSTNYYDDSDADFTLTNWAPIFKGSRDTPGYAYGVYVSGSYAYIADSYYGMQIIDISNQTNPTITGSYYLQEAVNIFVLGIYAYIADEDQDLPIINISDPSNPTLEGSYNSLPDFARDVFVSGSYAYVADDSYGGLQIINISNPANPSFAGSYTELGRCQGVYVIGNYAYMACGSSGLQVINVSNPANPTFAGSYNTPGTAHNVYVAGSYAYVADWGGGLQIIDISNPASPTLAGTYNTPGDALGVSVSGSYAYVADKASGLQIINVSNPASPTLIGTYDTPGYANGVFVSGSHAYVADGGSGLLILDISGLP